MKPLSSVAVFGLLPIPPAPDTRFPCAEKDSPPSDDAGEAVRARGDDGVELEAADELARLRRGLGMRRGAQEPDDQSWAC